MTTLSVRHITKRYRRRSVLNDVSFDADSGEIVGIVGENGSGKSTLLRILVGLLKADAGSVEIAGRFGYCDQEPHVFDGLTVAEHFEYFATAYGLSANDEWGDTRDELLEHFRYRSHLHVPVKELSGGTRQKLHLSLALIHHPDLLILDEPYLAFDWETYLQFWNRAEDLRVGGTTLVVVSHLAHDQARFSRILQLRDGRLQ